MRTVDEYNTYVPRTQQVTDTTNSTGNVPDRPRQKQRQCVLPLNRIKLAEPDNDGRRRVEGYAAVFGNRDAHADIIVKGAFQRSILERTDVKVLYQHNREKPIGLQEFAQETDFGLLVRGVLSNIPLVTDTVLPLLTDGVINGISIGYDVNVEEYNRELDAWLLKEIDVFEWSLVTFPANELAQVTSVKALDDRDDQHCATVNRHVKTLIHEFEGYFSEKDRQELLNCKQLGHLHSLIEGVLPDSDDPASKSTAHVDLQKAFLEGANTVVKLIKEGKPLDECFNRTERAGQSS